LPSHGKKQINLQTLHKQQSRNCHKLLSLIETMPLLCTCR